MTTIITATKDIVFQYPYSIEYANDYKGGYDNFAFFAMYEEDVMSKKDGQVNYASDDARYTRRIDAVKFLLRTEHEAQVVPAEVIESLVEWLDGLHLLFESKEEQEQLLAQEPVQCLEGCECDDCIAAKQTTEIDLSTISTDALIIEKKSLTDTRLMWLNGNLPLSAEQMAEVDARGCAVAAELAKRFAPVVEQAPAELVSRPTTIKTVQFEMGGKQYQTRSSWELLG